MPEDNTQIATDNNQMATPVPSTNDTTQVVAQDATMEPVMPEPAVSEPVASKPVQPLYPEQPVQPAEPAQMTEQTQPAVSDVVVMPGQEPVAEEAPGKVAMSSDIHSEVATKIGEAKNVLIALSSDPSVDELSAAIGLSLYLDKIGKRATAIYSGATPNTLEFLKPEETFEPSADTLQDFVIAINKEKADHLRYKIDGDYVKVYITPYKHKITEDDLDYSYGDYNVDLVIALDVANGIDLDSALREHGRIMHDASIINVTTGNPGKFGEIEWSDKKASSVSEMIAELLYEFGGSEQIAKDEATAFLTGVVAATNRFSNAKTTPETMRLASKLMESGANQQLVSKNITPDTENELFNKLPQNGATVENEEEGEKKAEEVDPTKLDIEHAAKDEGEEKQPNDEPEKSDSELGDQPEEVNADVTKKEHTLLDDLKAAEESLAHTGEETTPTDDNKKLTIENGKMTDDGVAEQSEATQPEPVLPEVAPVESNEPESSEMASTEPNEPEMPEVAPLESNESEASETPGTEEILEKPEAKIQPSEEFDSGVTPDDASKYGEMLQDAIESDSTSVEPSAPIMSDSNSDENPAAMNAPTAADAPEINGVPEMNYMPMPGAEILPPPPTPPIDGVAVEPPVETEVAQTEPIQPAVPVTEPEPTPLGEQPAMQDQVYNPQANDPGAFKIPGM